MACYLVCQLQMVAHLFAWASKVKALEEEFIYSLLELPEKNNVSLIAFGGCSMVRAFSAFAAWKMVIKYTSNPLLVQQSTKYWENSSIVLFIVFV